MTQPVRSFNLDKLAATVGYDDGYYTLSPNDSTYIDYGSSSQFRLGAQFCIETRVKFDEVFTSGVVVPLAINDSVDRLRLTVESGLTVRFYSQNPNNQVLCYSGLTAGEEHHLAVQVYDSHFFLYVDGTLEATQGINLDNLYSLGTNPSAYTQAIGAEGKIKYTRIWSYPLFDWMISRSSNYDAPAYPRKTLAGAWEYNRISKNIVPDIGEHGNYGVVTSHTDTINRNPYESSVSPAWKHTAGKPEYINFSTFPEYMQNKDDALTTEGWIYIDGSIAANFRPIEFSATQGNQDPFYIEINTASQAIARVYDRSANAAIVFNLNVPSDEWVHIGTTWSSKDTDMGFFVNGVKTTAVVTSCDSMDMTTLSGVTVGKLGNTVGMMRNWRLYHKKLSDSEMEDAYRYPTEYPVSERYVIAEWKFIEEETAWAYDCSDNGNYLYPTSVSGVNNDKWSYEENSGFYPLIWDGYSYATTAASIYGNHLVSQSDTNLAVHDNLVLEALFFKAYDNDRYTEGGAVDGGAPSINTSPVGIYYGPYVQVEQNDQSIRYTQYYSGLVSEYGSDHIYPYANIADSTSKFYANDGKWHHMLVMRSNDWTISGTAYNYVIYHDGRLRGVASLDRDDITSYNEGTVAWGHHLNGAVSLARLYAPTTSGMEHWFNGTNVWMSPIQAETGGGNIEAPNLLFDSYLDETNQRVLNIAPGYENSYDVVTTYDDVKVSKIPLGWNYYSVDGTKPRIPSPKFAITSFDITDEYTLELTYKVNDYNTSEPIYAVDGPQRLYVMSGLYYAHVTPNVIASGINNNNVWHKAVFRYDGNVASFLFDGTEVYSGIDSSWSAPGDTVKFGFYANKPLLHDKIDVRRIAAYDVWLDEEALITDRGGVILDMPLRGDLNNF